MSAYTLGLHERADGCHASLQPDAACDLMLDIDVDIDTVYRTLDPPHETPDVVERFRRMAVLEAR